MTDDPRLAAARYAAHHGEHADPPQEQGGQDPTKAAEQGVAPGTPPPAAAASQLSSFVEIAVQQAIRSGAFDNLAGAGKPLPRTVSSTDPDWWIRAKIERERITGLGPDALSLRTEHEEFSARMDALGSEDQVRAAVAEFNRRVVEARRQLRGGPPVVTPTRDVESEIEAWRERRSAGPGRAGGPVPAG